MTKQETALSIDSESFNAVRATFDAVLAATVADMERMEVDASSVTLKLSVSLTHMTVADGGEAREVVVPTFVYKVSSALAVKQAVDGKLEAELELTRDPGTGACSVRPLGGQLDMFDGAAPDEDVPGRLRSTGKSYSDHCATILRWAREDRSRAPDGQTPNEGRTDAQPAQSSFDTEERPL